MKKKTISLLLAGALALALAACGPAAEEPGPSPAPTAPPPESSVQVLATPTPEPTPAPEPPAPPLAAEYSLPDRDYRPWQEAYLEFLTGLREEELAVELAYAAQEREDRDPEEDGRLWEAVAGLSDSYSLYDVDKDGVPELFITFGDCEAAYHTKCYTFRDGEVACAGDFPSGHSVLYSYPGKNAALSFYGQMGCEELDEFSLADGEITEWTLLHRDMDVETYTAPEEIVPGAQAVESFRTRVDWVRFWSPGGTGALAGRALLLPVCDYEDGPAPTGSDSEQAREAVLAALRGDAPVFGAPGSGVYGGTGLVSWAEYVRPGGACPYNELPFQIARHAWTDLNGDGQEECVLWLEAGRAGEENAGQGAQGDQMTAVLSEQGGTVYAYYLSPYGGRELYADGSLRSAWSCVRLSFWKDQCYEYAVRPDPSARPVEWVDGSPAG